MNIPVAAPVFNGNEQKYLLECLESTRISSTGKFIDRFENEFAQFCETKHAITCCNGTAALHLALAALNVGPGDEVIVPALTYIATANAVTYCGAKPVFCDCDPVLWNIDAEAVEKLITPATKGIIVVHLYGHPVDMQPILKLAGKHKLFVVEDAAEALGAEYRQRRVGSIGDIGTFSFFGNKIITSGEGGALTTNDDALASRIRLLKGQGMDPDRRYWFPIIGFNYRMTNLQAAVACAQMERVDWHLGRRREIARAYKRTVDSSWFELPVEADWAKHVWWMYTVLLRNGTESRRDELIKRLANDGIETRPMFYPLPQMPPYSAGHGSWPVATNLAARGLNLPTHALLSNDQIEFVCQRLSKHAADIHVTDRSSVDAARQPIQF